MDESQVGVSINNVENVHLHNERTNVIAVPSKQQLPMPAREEVGIPQKTEGVSLGRIMKSKWSFLTVGFVAGCAVIGACWAAYCATGEDVADKKTEINSIAAVDWSNFSISSTGKIHNKNCTYFDGNYLPNDCKICNGSSKGMK